MLSKNQKGVAHIGIILLVLLVLGVAGFVGYRVATHQTSSGSHDSHNTHTAEEHTAATAEPDVALQNFGLASLDSVLVSKDALREYNRGLKGFYVFGDTLSGNRLNPNFEFAALKPGTKVVSAIDGIVGFIKQQPESNDYEVFIQPKENSMWTIGYDHLVNVSVKKGDAVKAGTELGEPAMQGNGFTRFEIQINKDQNGQTTHICPSTLLTANVKDSLLASLKGMQEKWESVSGLDLYDTAKQTPIGCLEKTLTPAQAEGR